MSVGENATEILRKGGRKHAQQNILLFSHLKQERERLTQILLKLKRKILTFTSIKALRGKRKKKKKRVCNSVRSKILGYPQEEASPVFSHYGVKRITINLITRKIYNICISPRVILITHRLCILWIIPHRDSLHTEQDAQEKVGKQRESQKVSLCIVLTE